MAWISVIETCIMFPEVLPLVVELAHRPRHLTFIDLASLSCHTIEEVAGISMRNEWDSGVSEEYNFSFEEWRRKCCRRHRVSGDLLWNRCEVKCNSMDSLIHQLKSGKGGLRDGATQHLNLPWKNIVSNSWRGKTNRTCPEVNSNVICGSEGNSNTVHFLSDHLRRPQDFSQMDVHTASLSRILWPFR